MVKNATIGLKYRLNSGTMTTQIPSGMLGISEHARKKRYGMIGAIIGDIAGSRFEWNNHKSTDFELFAYPDRPTDDSVMTLAVAKAILETDKDYDLLPSAFTHSMQLLGRRYPRAGYGGRFFQWIYLEKPRPYNSYGNGSAMRVSPCGFAADSLEDAIALARMSAAVTHNHPEGIRGAEAVAASIYLLRQGCSKRELRQYIRSNYYRLDFTLDEIRPVYTFDVTCQGSVPQAIQAFLESQHFEDAVRKAISIGGDSDTIAAIAGALAEACYGVPEELREEAAGYLDGYQRDIYLAFEEKYGSCLPVGAAAGADLL